MGKEDGRFEGQFTRKPVEPLGVDLEPKRLESPTPGRSTVRRSLQRFAGSFGHRKILRLDHADRVCDYARDDLGIDLGNDPIGRLWRLRTAHRTCRGFDRHLVHHGTLCGQELRQSTVQTSAMVGGTCPRGCNKRPLDRLAQRPVPANQPKVLLIEPPQGNASLSKSGNGAPLGDDSEHLFFRGPVVRSAREQ